MRHAVVIALVGVGLAAGGCATAVQDLIAGTEQCPPSDTQIRAVAAKGGLIGIGLYDHAVGPHGIEATVRAMRHVADLVGVEHVVFGSDFDGATTFIDVTGLPLVTQGAGRGRVQRAGDSTDHGRERGPVLPRDATRVASALMDISGARVLVTGGSMGIGKDTAALLVKRGAAVAICARNGARLRNAAEEIGARSIEADVSREDHATLLVEEAVDILGGLDVLINNAAIGSFAKLVDTQAEDVERVFRVNVLGALLVARSAAKEFISQGSGTIVNVGSTAARKGFPGGSAYASSKFALSGLTECWRAELRAHNIRVMQINPSEVQTAFGKEEGPEFNPTKLQSPDIAEAIVAMLEMNDRGFTTETTIWATNPQ